ncbi:MAG TPA: hypothetical protein DIU15_19425, partial [Deltaproteobacteria bacterium]|nr:hypothetical protein [Deltaproteobacteria bacterium]
MSRINAVNSNYSAIVERAASLRKAKAAKLQSKANTQGARFEVSQAQGGQKKQVAERVGDALDQVSAMQNNADQMVIDLASGNDVNLHNTMVELEKADI